jgi:hypothetical protein
MRTRGSAPRESRTGGQSSSPGVLRSAAARLSDILQREGKSKKKRKGGWFARSKKAPSRDWTMRGSWATTLALACLAGGFLLGRGTGSAQAAQDLTIKTPKAPPVQKPQSPEHLPNLDSVVKGAPDLSPQDEVKTLSQSFFVVLTYPIPEQKRANEPRQRAGELAYYLRQHGLDTARIKMMDLTSGLPSWAVLVYVPEKAQQQNYHDLLKAVPPPDFEPTFADRLKQPITLLEFTH